MIRRNRWRASIALLLLTGCVHATGSSVRRAGYDQVRFQRVMVWVLVTDLELRRAFEDYVIRERPDALVAGTSVLFPARTYTADEVGDALIQAGIDAVLTVQIVDAGASTSGYYPATLSNVGGTIVATPPRALTTTTAGFVATLQDARDGEPVWTATANARGTAGAGTPRELVRVAAQRLAAELNDADILVER